MDKMINFYNILPAKLKKKQKRCPHTLIDIPYRMAIIGSSGSMKTNTLINIIKLQAQNFDQIVINTRNANEPLYNYLKMKIPSDQLTINEGIENIPDVDTFDDPSVSTLVVFDDLMLEKNQDEKISPYFIRGRKCGCSCIYLSQNFTKIPLNVRRNINYLIMKKISSIKELTSILKNYSLECTKETLVKMYNACTAKQEDFLFVDLDAPDKQRFRHNFKHIISLG